jgi:Ca2+-binding EF-hand superfamily protein
LFHSNLIFRGIFDTIDINKDGTIDFNEFLVVVVLLNRVNDLEARLSFVFDM